VADSGWTIYYRPCRISEISAGKLPSKDTPLGLGEGVLKILVRPESVTTVGYGTCPAFLKTPGLSSRRGDVSRGITQQPVVVDRCPTYSRRAKSERRGEFFGNLLNPLCGRRSHG
jgi:hypothetical protein